MCADGAIAVRSLVATELVGEAVRRHRPSPTAALALGRALMGSVLLASGSKEGETVQLQLRGDGPLGGLTAIADTSGRVRGFAHRPDVDALPGCPPLDVGTALGAGTLAVVRSHPAWREPYTGVVALDTGEVAQDIARYLLESEQTPSALALGVLLSRDGEVTAAGGFLVQALPGVSEAQLELLEENARALPNPSALILSGLGADGIADRLLHGIGGRDRHRLRPVYRCPCERERVVRAARLLGADELRSLAERGERVEVRCEFCRECYSLSAEEVQALYGSEAAP